MQFAPIKFSDQTPERIKQNSIFQMQKGKLLSSLNLRKKHFLNVIPYCFTSYYDGKLSCEFKETSTWITLQVGRDMKDFWSWETFQAGMKHSKEWISDLL